MTYIDVLGHPTWVTDEGEGPPLLLLHGAFHGSDAVLPVFKGLAACGRVIAFDRRGHGRTPDRDDPFDYEGMVDEALGVLQESSVTSADVIGYSDGGIVGLSLALRRPDLVRTMVLIGTHLRGSGAPLELDPASAATAAMRRAYGAVSPDGAGHFDDVMRKSVEIFATGPNFDLAAIGRLRIPTLVLVGDRDSVPLSETLTLFETLPRAQLAVVPGTSHHVVWEKPDEVAALVERFLSRRAGV